LPIGRALRAGADLIRRRAVMKSCEIALSLTISAVGDWKIRRFRKNRPNSKQRRGGKRTALRRVFDYIIERALSIGSSTKISSERNRFVVVNFVSDRAGRSCLVPASGAAGVDTGTTKPRACQFARAIFINRSAARVGKRFLLRGRVIRFSDFRRAPTTNVSRKRYRVIFVWFAPVYAIRRREIP